MHIKYCSILIFCFLGYGISNAQHIDTTEAINIANTFFSSSLSNTTLKNNHLQSDNNTLILFKGENGGYIYGINMEDGGWVIISSDYRLRPILAYSEEGSISTLEDMPLPMQDIVIDYIRQIEYIYDNDTNINTNTHKDYYIPSLSTITQTVPNLLKKNNEIVRWKQSSNNSYNTVGCTKMYNKYCPAFYDTYSPCQNHALVGCTAVAMGQLMWYWQWPYYAEVPLNMLDSLGHTTGQTMHTYDWSKMPAAIYKDTEMSAVDFIATLLRDCGFSVNMKYRKNGSGAYLYDAADALKNIFGYSDALKHEYRPNSSDKTQQSAWLDKLKNELDNQRPLLYAGYRLSTSNNQKVGHAYLLTGYNSENYFCVNWGYGYSYETWVTLDDMTINENNYKYNQQAVFGVQPLPICLQKIPSTQNNWDINLVELYYDDVSISNKTYNSSKRGIIYSNNSIHLSGNVHIQKGANVHIAIRDMHCEESNTNMTKKINRHYEDNTQLETNIEEQKSTKSIIYPNPVHDILYIQYQYQNQICDICIYNHIGQLVLHSTENEIDTSLLPSGIYIITITRTDGITHQEKFIHL